MDNVFKSLSPEEKTIIADIKSKIEEMLAMSGEVAADAPVAPVTTVAPVAAKADVESMGMDKEDQEERDEEKKKKPVKKDQTSTQTDVSTGSDSAEEQIEDPQEGITEESVKEVAKAVLEVLKGKKSVKKSDTVVDSMSKLTNLVKKSIEDQNVLSETVAKMLRGLGIAEQVEAAQKSVNSPAKPIVNTDNAAVAKLFQELLSSGVKKDEAGQYESNANKIQKNLSQPDVLKAFMGVK